MFLGVAIYGFGVSIWLLKCNNRSRFMNSIKCKDIDVLLTDVLQLIQTVDAGCFYGRSADGGTIAVRVGSFHHNFNCYKSISITYIEIPARKTRKGRLKNFLEQIKALKIFGVIEFVTANARALAPWLERCGYAHRQQDYFLIIGEPVEETIHVLNEAVHVKNEQRSCNSKAPSRLFSIRNE